MESHTTSHITESTKMPNKKNSTISRQQVPLIDSLRSNSSHEESNPQKRTPPWQSRMEGLAGKYYGTPSMLKTAPLANIHMAQANENRTPVTDVTFFEPDDRDGVRVRVGVEVRVRVRVRVMVRVRVRDRVRVRVRIRVRVVVWLGLGQE